MSRPTPGGPDATPDVPAMVSVREQHRFDVRALERYLSDHVEGFAGPITVSQFQGGQSNPTYHLATPSAAYVLRRKPPGKLLPSAHAVDREHRVITALAGSGVPVPRTFALCEDPAVIGTAFYIMSYVRGRVFRDPSLPGVPPAERGAIYDAMNVVLARLHTVDWTAVGLADFGKTGSYIARQVHRWTQQYRASETERIEAMEALIAWMPAHIPLEDPTTLVHGDYRLGNMVIDVHGPRILAVLDWELSTLGHPLADLAYNCMPFRLSRATFDGFHGEDLAALGIPAEDAYVAAYCRRTGRPGIPDWDYYVAFAMFRLAAIAQGIMGRVIAGTASDPAAAERGARARPLAEAAWAIVQSLGTGGPRRPPRMPPPEGCAGGAGARTEEPRHAVVPGTPQQEERRGPTMATPSMSQPELFRPSLEYPDMPYDRMLTHAAMRWPENEALVLRDVSLTYRELEAVTHRFARALRGLGIGKGDRVCLFTTNCPEYVVAFYALARIGAVASPMNPSYRERELEYQVGDAEAVAIVVHQSLVPLVEAVRGSLPSLRHVIAIGPGAAAVSGRVESFAALINRQPPVPPPPVEIGPDDLVALPYSSGTTGLPKGVMLTHRNLVANNIQFVASLRIREADRLMIFLPFYHIYGTMLMGGGVYGGATAVLMERFEPTECLRLIERHRVTLFFVVPPVLLMLSGWPELGRYNLGSVRATMVGAAPVAPELARRFQDLTGVPVIQGYGLTEAGPLTHLNPIHADTLNVVDSAGRLAHDTEQKVVDLETGERVLAPGEVGEICVRGPQVMRGYWKAPEATVAALRDGWLYTGDIGYVDANGFTFIQDRKKEMIKYKGFGIAPAELEAVLLEHPGVADAAVIGKPDPEAGEIPKAFLVRRPGHAGLAVEEVVAFMKERLAGYKTPREVEFVDAIPKTASGKILRRVLKDRELGRTGP
jgi:long-chain acyl-CoA synthetase